VGLEGFRELYAKFSIREHESDDAIDILVHVGDGLHRQLATGEILFLESKKLLEENLSRCFMLPNLELDNRGWGSERRTRYLKTRNFRLHGSWRLGEWRVWGA
jgi:hypothetical protein